MEARITALLGSLLILGGCHRAAPPGPGSVEVVFSVLGEAVRATGTAGEAAVDSWTLLLYRDGRLAEAGTSSSGSTIRKTLLAGDYTAFAVVNPPASFDPARFTQPGMLAEAASALGDNAPGRLVMAGRRPPDRHRARPGRKRAADRRGPAGVQGRYPEDFRPV